MWTSNPVREREKERGETDLERCCRSILDGNSEKFREKGSEYREPIDSEKGREVSRRGVVQGQKTGEQRLNRGNVDGRSQGALCPDIHFPCPLLPVPSLPPSPHSSC